MNIKIFILFVLINQVSTNELNKFVNNMIIYFKLNGLYSVINEEISNIGIALEFLDPKMEKHYGYILNTNISDHLFNRLCYNVFSNLNLIERNNGVHPNGVDYRGCTLTKKNSIILRYYSGLLQNKTNDLIDKITIKIGKIMFNNTQEYLSYRDPRNHLESGHYIENFPVTFIKKTNECKVIVDHDFVYTLIGFLLGCISTCILIFIITYLQTMKPNTKIQYKELII